MAPAETPFAQQTTRMQPNDPSIVQGGNEIPSPPLLNDGIANEQPPINLVQQGIITNTDSFSADNMQSSEEQITFRLSVQTQDDEPSDNLLTSDFSQIMNTNLFSGDYSRHGQQSDGTDSNPQVETLSKESQEKNREKSKSTQSQSDDSTIAFRKKPNLGNDLDKVDPKKNIRKVLKNHKYYSIDSIENGKDLAEYIPGMYRLLDLYKDDGSNGLVDKIIISKDSLKKLCNDMVPLSFKSISEINYTKLNSISFRLVGCYGIHNLIVKLLFEKNIIDQRIRDLLIASQSSVNNTNKPSLRPGIYLFVVNADLGLVIHWPEIGCYEENASSQRKKNMTNLHRYLTKLTDHQLCLMSDEDLESFDWKLDNSDIDSEDEDDESRFEFEVKKSQEEQENFIIYPGFKVDLSEKIKAEINNNVQDDIPLHPIVVESAKNQSFVTRQLIKSTFQLRPNTLFLSTNEFSRELQTILQGRRLQINREKMSMKSLEILIKHGLDMEDKLLGPLHEAIEAARLKSEKKKNQEKSATSKDIELITNLAQKRLYDCYSSFEEFIDENSFFQTNISDEERIHDKYPDIESQINEKIKINSKAWQPLKRRYILTTIIIKKIIESAGENSEEIAESTIEIFKNMFKDSETDAHKLVKKYTEKQQPWYKLPTIIWDLIVKSFNSTKINRAIDDSIKISKNMLDKQFVQDLNITAFFGEFDEIKKNVIEAFFEEYKKWRNITFPNNIKEILPKVSELTEKLNEEFEQEKLEIETHEFERICNVIEEKYQNGLMQLNILNIVTDSNYPNRLRFQHEIETTQPNQLQITIYETSLDEADTFQLQDNGLHIPNLTLQYQCGFTFQIDPAIYDFRQLLIFL
ncbi:11383_t:CDS:10 [Funneliformis mosseae]|uniref:11383_t:CDS:1 n=1 Tax=Funneliformis mosseae TaxID=27381 RepID=A0A9N8V1Y6_FUNMO|nr:11383_t:CDS:10 [Funneliformis mosseae]